MEFRDFDQFFMHQLYNDMYNQEWISGSKDYKSLMNPDTWFDLFKKSWGCDVPKNLRVIDKVFYGVCNGIDTILIRLHSPDFLNNEEHFMFFYNDMTRTWFFTFIGRKDYQDRLDRLF